MVPVRFPWERLRVLVRHSPTSKPYPGPLPRGEGVPGHPTKLHAPRIHSTSSGTGLQPLDYAAVVLYLLLTFGIALWFGRKQKNTEDFFVGGRRMPWLAVGLSILATLFSTLSYLGVPGESDQAGSRDCLSAIWRSRSRFVVIIVLLWVPFFMRLRLTSAYEYLEQRFSYPVRLIGAVLFILLRLGWMSMVVYRGVDGPGQRQGGRPRMAARGTICTGGSASSASSPRSIRRSAASRR